MSIFTIDEEEMLDDDDLASERVSGYKKSKKTGVKLVKTEID